MAIYLWTKTGGSWWAHIPTQNDWSDVKDIMQYLGKNTSVWYKSLLHMPQAWSRRYNGNTQYQNSYGTYRSSTSYQSVSGTAYCFLDNGSSINVLWYSECATALTIRLFKDTYIEPDSTWTVLGWTLWSAGIFYNSDLWVISLTNGSDKNITMLDKNEWATTVYNSWDTLSESNCWKYYQRWNYYWFPFTWTLPKTSTTRVDTTWYGWSNPYYSDTFITRSSSPYDWSNPSNNNLRANSSSTYFNPVELMELKEFYLWKKIDFPYYTYDSNTILY